MITWMQKHNKFLIWTIWVATISFIGTGAIVGINGGGRKAGTVAKVGNVEIKQSSLNMAYSSLYSQYSQMMKGQFDDKKAKELGLAKQAFARLETQAKILSFANDVGIIVSDEEIAQKLQTITGFQKDNIFNKEIYKSYLQSQRLKAKVFEQRLRDELTIAKVFDLLNVETLPFEEESLASAINVSDKIAYFILNPSDVNFTKDDSKLKTFWEQRKENYLTPKMYTLSIVWTHSIDTNFSDDTLKTFYEQNSFKYANKEGKLLSFEEAKLEVSKNLRLKKTKKEAIKDYLAFKKGKLKASETVTLPLGDLKLLPTIWSSIEEKTVGDIIKHTVIFDRYASIKIDNVIFPKVKSFEKAKAQIAFDYEMQAKKEALLEMAQKKLNNFDLTKAITSDFIKLEEKINLKFLSSQESLQFAQKLFTSSKEKGMISLPPKIVVYKILEQKFTKVDENQTNFIKQTLKKLKTNTLESNLIKMLSKKYPTEVYVGGLKN